MYRLVSKGCKLVGCGSAVPSIQISNDDLSKIVDTSDEWISVRTGIRNRRILSRELFFTFHAQLLIYFVMHIEIELVTFEVPVGGDLGISWIYSSKRVMLS